MTASFLEGRFVAGAGSASGGGGGKGASLNDFAQAPVGPVTLPLPPDSQATSGAGIAQFGVPRTIQRTQSDPRTIP